MWASTSSFSHEVLLLFSVISLFLLVFISHYHQRGDLEGEEEDMMKEMKQEGHFVLNCAWKMLVVRQTQDSLSYSRGLRMGSGLEGALVWLSQSIDSPSVYHGSH